MFSTIRLEGGFGERGMAAGEGGGGWKILRQLSRGAIDVIDFIYIRNGIGIGSG